MCDNGVGMLSINTACLRLSFRKILCHPGRCLLPVEIIERCGLATGPATVELLPYLLPY